MRFPDVERLMVGEAVVNLTASPLVSCGYGVAENLGVMGVRV